MSADEDRYEMPVLTEQQRKELLARVRFAQLQKSWSSDGLETISESDMDILKKIALAALTAQPVKCPSFDDYKPHVAEELRAAFIAAIRAAGYEVQE